MTVKSVRISDDRDEDAEKLARIERALADVEAGRVVSYAKVKAWLLSWGTDCELPKPDAGNFYQGPEV